MKKVITVLSMILVSSTAFAASDSCLRAFSSLMGRQYEVSRVETSALNRLIKGDHKIAEQLQREADRQKLEIEERKEVFLSECVTK